MSYSLRFLPSAKREWDKLGSTVKEQFKAKLAERLLEPEVPADRLHGGLNFYKIKLRSAGYRLVYEVEKGELVVYVFAVGKRERGQVYSRAFRRNRDG